MIEHENKLVRVLSALVTEPWMITPIMHKTLTDIVCAHAFGGSREQDQHKMATGYPANKAKRDFALVNNVAVIPCEGVIGRKFDNVLYSSGVTSIDIWQRMLNSAMDDDEVDCALLVFDSPGGAVTGVPEAAAAVAAASKPVIAYADGQMNSAAYYIASQAAQIYAMPSASVGSIGVYLQLLDVSRAAEMEGIKVEMFKSGKHKGMGVAGTSLTDEQRTMLQTRVDQLGAQFRQAVISGRQREIASDVMQGQTFAADDAVKNGLIDAVADFERALADASFIGKKTKQTKRG